MLGMDYSKSGDLRFDVYKRLGKQVTVLMEERLKSEPSPETLSLKNGAQIETREGIALFQCLSDLIEDEPELFKALLTLAQNPPGTILPAQMRALRDIGGY